MSMVVGNGVIANRFIDYSLQSDYLIFAGNVNDSAISDGTIIKNEETAILSALSEHSDITFVYFSSCSIVDQGLSETPYVQHKVRMEKLIQSSAEKFVIFRLPQVMGLSDAKSSLVNYLVDAISNQKSFELWTHATKNLIDIDDIHQIVGEVLRRGICLNKTINIANTDQISVFKLVQEIEKFVGMPGNYKLVSKGSSYELDVSDITPILFDLKISFEPHYIATSLNKYYAHLFQRPKLLSVVVPTYNEENGIAEFYRRTKYVLNLLAPRFIHEIIFVNDFSTDNTYEQLKLIAQSDNTVKLINFSRNFGNQIAITAGIDNARGDIAVVIDDDLQDPPEIIMNFVSQWDKGYKVVYGVRPKRRGGSKIFKLIAKWYYRVVGGLSDTQIPNDTGDFRLIDRVVIDNLKKIKEENRYYRGLVAWVGFPQIGVIYDRDSRFAGVSTFTFKKYVNFALNGLTSFTEKPLYFSSLVGALITIVSFILALVLVASKIFDPSVTIRGWTSLTVIVLFFGGIQLFSIGILGVYIGKIYREVKGRPLYIVEDTKNLNVYDIEN